MCEQPHLPKLCLSNSLIYPNMTFWLYYTTTHLEKKTPKPLSCGKKRSVFCRESWHFKKTPTSFLLTGQLICKLGKCLTFARSFLTSGSWCDPSLSKPDRTLGPQSQTTDFHLQAAAPHLGPFHQWKQERQERAQGGQTGSLRLT